MRILLLVLLLIAALSVISARDNLKAVIIFSVFSMICAFLYYLYQAPDVAIAELAIGAAIIPLIYVIAISRHRKFVVLNLVSDGFIEEGARGHRVLEEFCSHFGLDMEIITGGTTQRRMFLHPRDIDLVVTREEDHYLFSGRSSSYLFNKLEDLTRHDGMIRIEQVEEGVTRD